MKKVDLAFNRLLNAYGKKRNKWTRGKDGRLKAKVGSWTLDSAYGGYKVAEISNTSGGERDLFDQRRRKPTEFVKWVNVVISGLKQKRR